MKTLGWIIGLVAIVGLLTGIVLFDSRQQQAAVTVPDEVGRVADDEWVDGPSNARVTLIEYGDFQCPACAFFAPQLRQLRTDVPNDLRLVFRQFPLKNIHAHADEAARVSEAAGNQGKFWEMYDLLYAKQSEWAGEKDAHDLFHGYGREIGLDDAQFETDLESDATKDAVNDDIQSANAAKVDSTPTFILNGERIANPKSYDEFKALIQAKLQ
ncbi:DsbA family protein [Candidatus Berkelbacteria bacterium]|nr:DsbA family protein [Candidatus Berkelbacteria bacterium]